MTAIDKPTITTVTVALVAAGWPRSPGPGCDGFTVRPYETGVICVEYDPGVMPISHEDALAAMAEKLRAKGWLVTEAGRVLVSGG